jgi:hypothetical protein
MSIWGGCGGGAECAGTPRTEDTTAATYCYPFPRPKHLSFIEDFSTLLVFKDSRRIKLLRLLRHFTVRSNLPRTPRNTETHFVKRKLALKVGNFDPVAEPNDLQEVGGGCGDWMGRAQDRDRWRALVSTVMNFRVP